MLPKITLTEFNKIKERLSQELKMLQTAYENADTDSMTEEQSAELERQLLSKYIEIQNELFEYDLSDIPFEAWEEMSLFSYDRLDFSKNHANLDFNLIDLSSEKPIDIRGCQIRNLKNTQVPIHENYVDDQVKIDFPNLFLSDLFSSEFKEKFYTQTLTLSDLLDLSAEQLEELDSKNIKQSISKNLYRTNSVKEPLTLLGLIHLKNYIELYKNDIEFLKDLSTLYSKLYNQKDELLAILKNKLEIEDLKSKVDELFNKAIMEDEYFLIQPQIFSEDFKSRHRDIFPVEKNLPEDVIRRINSRSLLIDDIIKYHQAFYGIDLKKYMKYDSKINSYLNFLGKDFAKIVGKFPHIFSSAAEILEHYSVESALRKHYEATKEKALNEEIPFDCINVFMVGLMKAHFGSDGLEYSGNATPDIYQETSYPDWVKKSGYYLSSINNMNDYYLPLISSKTEIKEETLKKLFDILGISNIKRMYQEDFFFTPTVIKILANTIENLDLKPSTSYEDFQKKLIELIFKTEKYARKQLLEELKVMKSGHFRDRNSGIFLPLNAPEELQKLYYSPDFTPYTMLKESEWIEWLKHLDFKKIGFEITVQTINTSEKGPWLPQDIDFLSLYLNYGSTEELLIFLNKYKDYFNENHKFLIDLKDISKESLEREIKKAIYKDVLKSESIKISPDSPQEFKDEYPDLFISEDAPELLKKYFYSKYLTLSSLTENPEWIKYLGNVNPKLIKNLPLEVNVINSELGKEMQMVQVLDMENLYIKKYGLQAYLEFIVPYGKIAIDSLKQGVIDIKDTSKEALEEQMEKVFYRSIVERKSEFHENLPERFKNNYPHIFLAPDAPDDLKVKFYSRQLKCDDLRKNPVYKDYFNKIELPFAFVGDVFKIRTNDLYAKPTVSIPKVLEYISKEEFLELLTLYGTYFANLGIRQEILENNNFEELKLKIEKEIIETLKDPAKSESYIKFQEDAPEFIKKALPDYFLDSTAPESLKNYFYQITSNYQLSFELIGKNPDWVPFLKGKSLESAFRKINSRTTKVESIKFINLFGQDTALKLACARTETINEMISKSKVEVMYEWWLKTGKKFIPDFVVMQNFDISEADKFLSHGKDWSSLMKNIRFSKTREGREAMLKLAYSFGIFDNDQQGSKRLDILLNDLPRKISSQDMEMLLQDERDAYYYNSDERFMEEINPSPRSSQSINSRVDINTYERLKYILQNEGFNISGNSIFAELYRQNEDGTYTLKINTQMYPKSRELIREVMEKNNISNVLTAEKAHKYFGAFEVQYDRDFREFLIKNLEELTLNPDYAKYISAIQRQFQLIKITNSNRVLTPELAVSFVQENKYEGVEVGNEELVRVSSAAGYSQEDFNTLQRIYNYGKARVTSSIPRIEGKVGRFTYEILRLTDPLAIAIGTLTDCCQELGNAAETCMEHSMVDKHGRIFLIRDEEGNYVSQSWVWRNKDVLCFDNVEIPDKQLLKSGLDRSRIGSGARNDFTDEILAIYKLAASELIAEDEKVFQELLERGLITEEQYQNLKLRKITVGAGYNDIAASIRESFSVDSEKLARPLAFVPPVELRSGLYTNDSTTQYVLENRKAEDPELNEETPEQITPARERYEGETIPVHYDKYFIYDMNNISRNEALTLQKLEAVSGRYSYNMNTAVSDYSSSQTIMEEISGNYGTPIETTNIIMNPNFAIMFDNQDSEIVILDILANQQIEPTSKDKILLQLKLALLQLVSSGKTLNISFLRSHELQLINEILELSEDRIIEERGLSHGTK